METAMFYTHAVIWTLGALLVILGLLATIQVLAWRLYRDVVGWPVIVKAMRAYRLTQSATSGKVKP